MAAHREVFAALEPKLLQDRRLVDRARMLGQDLLHGRARLQHRFRTNAFGEEIAAPVCRVDQIDFRGMVDDGPVHFLGHALVEAPVPGFHMEDRNPEPLGRDDRETAIRIAEEKQGIGLLLAHPLVGLRDDVGNGLRRRFASRAQEMVGLTQSQAVEEDLVELVVVVLAGVHQHVLHGAIELGNDAGELDDLGTRADQRHHLHAGTRPWRPKRSVVAFAFSTVSAELNSPLSAFFSFVALRLSSGSIGRMARYAPRLTQWFASSSETMISCLFSPGRTPMVLVWTFFLPMRARAMFWTVAEGALGTYVSPARASRSAVKTVSAA